MKNLFSKSVKGTLPETMRVLATMLIFILAFVGTNSYGQKIRVCLDTIQDGDTIRACTINFNQLVIYKKTSAINNINWQGNQPSFWTDNKDSVVLNTTNSGSVWFASAQTPTIEIKVFLVGPPVNPALIDYNSCGDIYNHTFDALNANTGSWYTWSNGATTQVLNISAPGTYWVKIDDGCGIKRDTAVVTANHVNDANVGVDTTICLNDTVVLKTHNVNIINYLWSTGASTSTIKVYVSGTYSVTTTDNAGCVSRDTMVLDVTSPYTGQEICFIEFDTLTLKNKVNWSQHNGVGIDSLEVSRKITSTTFQVIGKVSNTQTSFIDQTSSPQSEARTYAVNIIDGCGNRSPLSIPHTTFVLGIGQFVPDTLGQMMFSFSWANYVGAVVDTYALYGVLPNGTVVPIASGLVPAIAGNNQYNWFTTNNPYVQFFIGFWNTCGAKANYFVRSNYIQGPTGIEELNQSLISLVINGQNVVLSTDLKVLEIRATNILGQTISKSQNKKEITVPCRGITFLQIRTTKGIMVKKVIIL